LIALIAAAVASLLLAWLFTRLTDRFMHGRAAASDRILKSALLAACCYAAYTLGANNAGNAVGVFYGMKLMAPMKAGFIGGVVMALAALTWGRPILEKVGKGIAQLDLNMAAGAKAAQSLTAHIAAILGYPTSMNQALIGGVAGASAARGRQTLNSKALKEIVLSWFFILMLAGIVAFVLYSVLSFALWGPIAGLADWVGATAADQAAPSEVWSCA